MIILTLITFYMPSCRGLYHTLRNKSGALFKLPPAWPNTKADGRWDSFHTCSQPRSKQKQTTKAGLLHGPQITNIVFTLLQGVESWKAARMKPSHQVLLINIRKALSFIFLDGKVYCWAVPQTLARVCSRRVVRSWGEGFPMSVCLPPFYRNLNFFHIQELK